MKRTIEIQASFSGKISKGNYENESPFFSLKEVMEIDEKENKIVDDEFIRNRQHELHELCRKQFKQHEAVSNAERIANEYKNLRFYDIAEGVKYPSVTSIIGWDSDFHMSEDELAQYAARGTIGHKRAEIYLQTGEWKEPKDIPEIYPEIVIVKRGNLNLSINDMNVVGFFKDYPIKVLSLETKIINNQQKYAGRQDVK
jgi:hypothetical protein